MHLRAYSVIIAGFFTVSISYSIRYAYGMLLPAMLSILHINKIQAGGIFSAYFITYTIATPILGTLSDRFNYRLILTSFTMILACGTLLMAYATTLLQASLSFSLVALGHAACWAPVSALVQRWVPDDKRCAAISIVTMGVGLGISLWSILLPMIVEIADCKAAWLCLGSLGLIVALLNLVLVRDPEAAIHIQNALTHQPSLCLLTLYKEVVHDRIFWIIGAAYLLVGFNVLIPFTFLPIYAREVLDLPYSAATRFLSVIALSGIAGQVILGLLPDTVGRIRIMILSGLIMGSGCLGMAISPNRWILYFFTGVYGFGYGVVWPAYATAASDFFSSHHTGCLVGLWTVFLGLGSIISPPICGWAIDLTGNYTWGLLLGLISGVLSAIILLRLFNLRHV